VSPGYAGIKINYSGTYRGVQDIPVVTGWQWYTPFFSTVLEYPTFVQTAKWEGPESITFNSKEDLGVTAAISVSYQIEHSKVPAFYVKFRSDDLKTFSHGFFHNVTRDMFNEVGGQFSIEGLMGPEKEHFLTEVRTRLNKYMKDFGVEVVQLGFIGSPQPPQQVLDQLNAKVAATQAAMKAENEVRETRATAQKTVINAEALANAQVANAKGEAEAAIERARGQAQANETIARSITPNVIEWQRLQLQGKWIEAWQGNVPQVAGSGSGMLLDLRGMATPAAKK
jgi:regulator of protease activity HflC (stomatin/prohibitin superfamily)